MSSEIAITGSAPVVAGGPAPRTAAARPAPVKGAPVQATGSGSTQEAAAQVGQRLEQARPELKLQVDAGSGRTVFRVVQQGTGQVIMQVPSEEILSMSRRLREAEGQPGTLVDREG